MVGLGGYPVTASLAAAILAAVTSPSDIARWALTGGRCMSTFPPPTTGARSARSARKEEFTMAAFAPRPESLSQSTFAKFLASRPKVIVHLGPYSKPESFRSGIIKHFSADLGRNVAFGCLDTSQLVYAPWPLKFVRDLFNEALTTAPSGYYLFEQGQARAFHPGSVSPTTDEMKSDLIKLGVMGFLSLVLDSSKPIGAMTDAMDDRHARAVIAHFEAALAPPTEKKDTTDWTTILANQKVEPQDPYTLLGVSESSTDEEIKQAYRTQTTLSHPDKVAHLAPAIQKFVSDNFRAVKDAYEQIMASRQKAKAS